MLADILLFVGYLFVAFLITHTCFYHLICISMQEVAVD
jgi:hypothetical protein